MPEEGRFDYGEAFSQNPAIRYRQMLGIEGRDAAKQWAKTHMLRLAFSGVSVREIAQTFQFGIKWVEVLLAEARREMREQTATQFDGLGVVAEHMALYKAMRESAFFSMNKNNVTEIDKVRARDNLLAVMSQEMSFVEKVGGLKGVNLQAGGEDEAASAARRMSDRISHLTQTLEELGMEELTGDEDGEDQAEQSV